MKRRHFLATLGTLPAGTVLVAATPPPTVRSLTADVLVIGGGSAGAIAAIQAGRLGAKTVLVEAGSQLDPGLVALFRRRFERSRPAA